MRMAASIPEGTLVKKVRLRLGRHGARNFIHALCLRAVNAALPFKILKGVAIEAPNAAFLACPPDYAAGLLDQAQLREFAADADNEMSPQFVETVLTKGDECYAIRDGTKLAAYGWYARTPTPVGVPSLLLRFSDAYVYMYKGFTSIHYRGKRLHAIGMTRALDEYRRRGYRGLVSYVESTNFDSLKSCERMGYRVFGSIYLVRIFGRDFAFASPGCKAFDFRVQRA